LHISYKDPNLLNEIIADLAKYEIYDLVRVDYFSSKQESVKKELMDRAGKLLKEKLNRYEVLLNIDLDTLPKQLTDAYKVVLPVERYKSYQAYNSSSLNLKKTANVNKADKSVTLYYQPVIDKEFDFVINPTVLEPVIQIMYEVKMVVKRQDLNQIAKPEKSFILVTPNGDLKEIKTNN
ncbi:MAG: SIMPL domain-containing protein, partial [Bacteroidota bacterium]